LVFCTWEQEKGTALVTYDALPDGVELPPILSVDASERQPTPKKREVVPSVDMSAEDFDPDKFMAELVEEAASKLDIDESGDLG
jgi:hypothetical protein